MPLFRPETGSYLTAHTTKRKSLVSNSFARCLLRTKRILCDVFSNRTSHGWIAVRLFLCFCIFVYASSPHSIQRADPMVQGDYVLVVEQDIRASKTDKSVLPVAAGYHLLQNQSRIVQVGGSFAPPPLRLRSSPISHA
jgi:hypothetical protein